MSGLDKSPTATQNALNHFFKTNSPFFPEDLTHFQFNLNFNYVLYFTLSLIFLRMGEIMVLGSLWTSNGSDACERVRAKSGQPKMFKEC